MHRRRINSFRSLRCTLSAYSVLQYSYFMLLHVLRVIYHVFHAFRLQDVVTNLRHKINTVEKLSKSEIKRLKSDVLMLYNKISAIEKKADHFLQVNVVKFNQVWKFNKDNAVNILQKISEMDRLIHQQLLGLKWSMAEDPPSKYVPREHEINEQIENTEKEPLTEDLKKIDKGLKRKSLLLNKILKTVSDSSGFLVESRLTELLEPYAEADKLLVKLDNIFNALGVNDINDVSVLSNYLDPYLECSTCQGEYEEPLRIQEESRDDQRDFLLDTHPSSDGSGSGILNQIMNMVTQQVNMVHDVVSEVSSGIRKDSSRYFQTPSADSIAYSVQQSLGDSELYEDVDKPVIHPRTSIDEPIKCRNPNHELFITSANVLNALKDFISNMKENENFEFDVEKSERTNSTKYDSSIMRKDDVDAYWNNYKHVFTEDNEKLWDALMLGLRKYHSVLQDRHNLSTEVEQLSIQNNDLRRLLTSYTIHDSMKKEQSFFIADDTEHLLPLLSKDQNPAKLREVQDTLTRL